jgi:ribosomal protein S18 acetylase RimI-like enzyme
VTAPFEIGPLAGHHERTAFSCGVEALDRYLATQAMQDQRRRVAGCYVAIEAATGQIAGYYTIAAASMPLSDVTAKLAKNLPRYPLVPCVRLGRLAVATAHKRKGLGAALLIDAIERSVRSEIVAFAMIVDAKDEAAIRFYRHHGFEAFASAPVNLYMPLSEIARRLVVS